ncbi:hypothetical protein [Streptomyces sirii]|uniref:hypothetical protein n=1 Tax=Streptomyces sirii TaxID=3127701 RepID=UPI003D35AA0C
MSSGAGAANIAHAGTGHPLEEVVNALARVGEVEAALILIEQSIDNPAVQDRLIRGLMSFALRKEAAPWLTWSER